MKRLKTVWLALFCLTCLLACPCIYGSNDVCVHLNGGDDVAYIGEYNTLEIWIANDIPLRAVQIPLEVCWGPLECLWVWDALYGSNPPFDRHGDAINDLILFSTQQVLDNQSCDPFVIGAASFDSPFDLPPAASRLCYSMQFGIISQSPLADGIQVRPYAYFASNNWLFQDPGLTMFPPDFCGQAVASMDDPVATPVTFDIVYREENACGDVDCNDLVNISDAVYLIAYIFGGGPAPCAGCP